MSFDKSDSISQIETCESESTDFVAYSISGKMRRGLSIRIQIPAIMITVVLLVSAIFSVFMVRDREKAIIQRADDKLLVAANAARVILGPKYHTNIVDKNSMSPQAYERIVTAYDRLCHKTGLQYIWSLMILNDQIVFTSSTHSNHMDPNSEYAKFLELHTNPDIYRKAFNTMEPQYSTFNDKWGEGRMLLIPEHDFKGRKHLFAASIRLDRLNELSRYAVIQAIWITILVVIAVTIISLLIARSVAKPIVRLTKSAEKISSGDLEAELIASGNQEVSVLSDSLNVMRSAIKKQMETRAKQAAEMREFYRQTISIVTDGKLRITGKDIILPYYRDAQHREDISDHQHIPIARHKIMEYLSSQGLPSDVLDVFISGVGEAINNAVKHAGSGEVFCGTQDGIFWVGVKDQGPGISTLTLPSATLQRGYSSRTSMGMGYTIMLDVAEWIELCTGSEGTTVILFIDLHKSKAKPSVNDLPDIWDTIST